MEVPHISVSWSWTASLVAQDGCVRSPVVAVDFYEPRWRGEVPSAYRQYVFAGEEDACWLSDFPSGLEEFWLPAANRGDGRVSGSPDTRPSPRLASGYPQPTACCPRRWEPVPSYNGIIGLRAKQRSPPPQQRSRSSANHLGCHPRKHKRTRW